MQAHYLGSARTATRETPLHEVAAIMGRQSLGSVVIVDEGDRPIGIVTDRDLCCRGVARGAGRDGCAGDVMSQPLFTASPHDSLEVLIDAMKRQGLRRLPIVDGDQLVGLVALDDILVGLSDHLASLSDATRKPIERARAAARRRLHLDEDRAAAGGPRKRLKRSFAALKRGIFERSHPAKG